LSNFQLADGGIKRIDLESAVCLRRGRNSSGEIPWYSMPHYIPKRNSISLKH